MKLLLKIINTFFVTLGVIFFIIILIFAYLIVADPFNLKPLWPYSRLFVGTAINQISEEKNNSEETPTDRNPALSAEQEATLESFGVDPATLPTTLTPELEACFVKTLGQQRVDEIKGGATPSAIDFFSARSCLE